MAKNRKKSGAKHARTRSPKKRIGKERSIFAHFKDITELVRNLATIGTFAVILLGFMAKCLT